MNPVRNSNSGKNKNMRQEPDVSNGMNRRVFLKRCAAAAGGLVLSNRALDVRIGAKRPNIVFILIDDMGWRDAGCYGSTYYETPNIDRLARQGMRFTDAYASAVCSPTRASVMTGKYPARLNLTDYIPGRTPKPSMKLLRPEFNQALPLEETTIAEALKPAGYVSACVGKWHLGKEEPFQPQAQGFYYTGEFIKKEDNDPKSIYTLTRRAIDFIERYKNQPFFLFLSHHAVHLPIEARDELIAKYEAKPPSGGQDNAAYAAMIEHMDDGVGQVMAKLGELGLDDRTIVIFYSDNGGYSYERDGKQVTSNAPLREGKGTLYEGGIRVPMIVRWPGEVKAGSVCTEPVIRADFYPTILEIAGVKDAPSREIDGVSLMGLLRQRGGFERDAIYWHYPHYHHTTPVGAIRQGNWKLLEFFEFEEGQASRVQLYNLAEDIGEQNDLAETEPDKRDELHNQLKAWRQSVNAQMPLPNPDYTG